MARSDITKRLLETSTKKNNELSSKLNILYKAFDNVIGNKETIVRDTKSALKTQHDEELSSVQWKEKREEVFDKYGKQCVECGSRKNIEVHHLVYRNGKHLWEYSTDELVPLCRECHCKVHKNKNHIYHEKYVT